MKRTVSAYLSAQALGPATVELQVAVAGPADETVAVTLDGWPLEPTLLDTEGGGRMHVVEVTAGRLEVSYRAEFSRALAAPTTGALDRSTYLRPSRYAESDRLGALARVQFSHLDDSAKLVLAVAEWVAERTFYVSGRSRGTDGAVDALLAGEGVCRDYAHLVVGVLRALNVPARLVSVYAPGLSPMDFHAVAEALVDGTWYVVDATRLAPRASLVRIATGRDAADVSFLSAYGGEVRLDSPRSSRATCRSTTTQT